MHPFEKVVMELTIRARQKRDGLTLSKLLDDVHQGRKELLSLSKDWIYKIKNAASARESFDYTEEAKEVLANVFIDLIQESLTGDSRIAKEFTKCADCEIGLSCGSVGGCTQCGKVVDCSCDIFGNSGGE